MAITVVPFRSPIRLIDCVHDPLCHGFEWQIDDEAMLAKLVAWTMQGKYRHARNVIDQINPSSLSASDSIKEQAIGLLTLPVGTGNVPRRWHRDGLVFQHIAWLAAILQSNRNIAASMPHLIPAHKGFDALLVPLTGRLAKSGIIICEEKATENPRNQFYGKVLPSISEIESHQRDAELNAELTCILERYGVENIEEILSQTNWLDQKYYRVSITTLPGHGSETERRALFADYDTTVPGDISRRRAETFMLVDLRGWMDSFCASTVKAIEAADV
jgi:hypothetical protein